MKTLLLALILYSASMTSSFASFSYEEDFRGCDVKCRMILSAVNHEMGYHSGWSSSKVTKAILEACSSEAIDRNSINECKQMTTAEMIEKEGTLMYLAQTSCVYESVADTCRR